MRPVTRGVPAHYPNFPTVPIPSEVQQSISFLFSAVRNQFWTGRTYVDVLLRDIANVEAELAEHDLELDMTQLPALPNFNSIFELDDYQRQADQAWGRLLDSGNAPDQVLLDGAGRLVAAMQAQISWYEGAVKPNKAVITKTYTQARGDLITNIGQYCSYCEMPLAASLAVEHMLPKHWFWRTSVNWDNFLLACPICNSIKNDAPTWSEGQVEAKKATPTPTFTDIENGARSLLLWPSDATNYQSFAANYALTLYIVIRYQGGKIFREIALTPAQVDPLVRARGLELAPDDGSGFFRAWLSPYLGNTPATPDLGNFLNQTGGNGQALADLINAVQNGTHPNILADAAQYHLPPGATVTITNVVPNAVWDLSQKETYVITTSGAIAVTKPDGNTVRPNITFREAADALVSGFLPDAIAAAIGVDPLGRTVQITKTGLNEFKADVYRNYRVQLISGALHVTARQIFPVELRLVGANTLAQSTVTRIALNKLQPKDPKSSDRRTARRIRAYFSAVEALGCLSDAIAINNAQLLTDLQAIIIQNAVATGFWSVWNHVFSTYLSGTWNGKGAFLTALGAAFPGTR